MIQAEDVAVSQIAEINDALDDAMSGKHIRQAAIHIFQFITTPRQVTGSIAWSVMTPPSQVYPRFPAGFYPHH